MPKITKRSIDALRPEPDRDVWVWDTELRGFGVRLKPSGAASYLLQYRTAQGKQRRLAFAKVGTLTPDEARSQARRLLAQVEQGEDPSGDRHAERRALTFAELCAEYMEAARAGLVTTRFGRGKSEKTKAIDEGRVSRHLVPTLGSKIASTLTRAEAQRAADAIAAGKTAAVVRTKARGVAKVTGGAGTATRVMGLAGGIWTWAAKRGLVPEDVRNPFHGLDLRADQAKDRVLSPDELSALGKAIRAAAATEARPAADALLLIALTGLRRGEAYGLKWAEIDWDASCLRLTETKTGKSMRAIGRAAVDHLRTVPRLHDRLVFPNADGDGPADLKKRVAAIFDAAGLHDARGHDLRRTFASTAADLDYGDSTIAELLGHAPRGVTHRHYIRRPDAALVAAADRVADRIADRIAASLYRRKAEVVPLRPSREEA